jgi:inorganic pyrophosphatase
MPANYVIDKHHRLVISRASGVLTFQDCVRHQDRLIKDPDFDPTYNQLLDFFEVTSIQLDELAIRFLMIRHIFSGQSRRAVTGSAV